MIYRRRDGQEQQSPYVLALRDEGSRCVLWGQTSVYVQDKNEVESGEHQCSQSHPSVKLVLSIVLTSLDHKVVLPALKIRNRDSNA